MAWTTPSTWVAGTTLGASQLNEQVRDNLSYLYPLVTAPPFCNLTALSTTTTLVSGGAVIAFDTENEDTDAMYNSATSSSRITINTAGLYLVHGGYVVSVAAANLLRVGIMVNGALLNTGYVGQTSGTTGFHGVSIHRHIRLTAGQYVELWGATGSGLATSTAANTRPWFQAQWVAA